VKGNGLGREESGGKTRQSGILGAADLYLAMQRSSAAYYEFVHKGPGGEANVQSCLYLRERNVITAAKNHVKGEFRESGSGLAVKARFFGNAPLGVKHHKIDRKHTESSIAIMRFYGFSPVGSTLLLTGPFSV